MHTRDSFKEKLPYLTVFGLFCAIIVAATIYYSPGWGIMDDAWNLSISGNFWKNNPSLDSYIKVACHDITANGRFRPIYPLWVITVYKVFLNSPSGLYLFLALINLAALFAWSAALNRVFTHSPQQRIFNLFIYPLAFFIFTPFWNNFMYISIQEKFIYWFCGLSLYFHIRGYQDKGVISFLFSFLFMFLGILGKEPGISLAAVYCVYALFDLLFFKKNPKAALISLVLCAVVFAGYYLFIRNVWSGDYSSLYKNNFSLGSIIDSIKNSPVVIKGLLAGAFIFTFAGILSNAREKSWIRPEFSLFPLFLGAYIIILAPWGFSNYPLAPLAPMAFIAFYPLYACASGINKNIKIFLNYSIVVMAFIVLIFINVPRISKMADVKKTVKHIVAVEKTAGKGKYFFAPPFVESCDIMSRYTGTGMFYLSSGTLSENMLEEGPNFLVFEDRCTAVTLDGVSVKNETYSNGTWKIFILGRQSGGSVKFLPSFEKNLFQRLKDYLKNLR